MSDAAAGENQVVDPLDAPDRRDGHVYVMPDGLMLAVEVALATGRPLLLRGEPGSGKSSLAAHLARRLGWRYYEHVVTSQTGAQDLLWRFDSVRRLADAQTRRFDELDDFRYVEPGVLWWAFAPLSARRRGRAPGDGSAVPPAAEPFRMINAAPGVSPDHAVVLIDEIDKAEPDMPNNLLVPLGSSEFLVAETNTLVRKEPPRTPPADRRSRHLIIVTTNEERELPQAFLRRCLVTWLDHPDEDRLVAIAAEHVRARDGEFTDEDEKLARAIAQELGRARTDPTWLSTRAPSTAEFLDALWACRSLGIGVDTPQWAQLRGLTLMKPLRPPV